MVAMAPGMFLAHSVVPSSGSTAMSTFGPVFLPTFSPMNSIGASSRSPSPMTMVPSIGNLLISLRSASAAPGSASFSLPRPLSRAAATAARSVTRTISIDRIRSSVVVDFSGFAGLDDISLTLRGSGRRRTGSVLLDTDHLRLLGYDTLALDRLQGPAHRVLVGRIGDQNNRRGRIRAARIVAPMGLRAMVALHDRFERDLLGRQKPGDRREGSGPVDRGEPDIIAALVALHGGLLDGGQPPAGAAERRAAHAARDVADVGDHRRGGRVSARPGPAPRARRQAFGLDRHRIGHAHHLGDGGILGHHGGMHALLDPLFGAHRDPEQFDAVAELVGGPELFS